jgi:hypothetical protein
MMMLNISNKEPADVRTEQCSVLTTRNKSRVAEPSGSAEV